MADVSIGPFELSFALDELHAVIVSEPMLSWFRLTDGVFDMRVGATSVYGPLAGGVEYYVARLWEDLIRLEPFAVEPVPAPLVTLLRNHEEWRRPIDGLMERSPGQTRPGGALSWWTRRRLDSSYLADPPDLAFVRLGSDTRIVTTGAGSMATPTAVAAKQFSEEVASFDKRLSLRHGIET